LRHQGMPKTPSCWAGMLREKFAKTVLKPWPLPQRILKMSFVGPLIVYYSKAHWLGAISAADWSKRFSGLWNGKSAIIEMRGRLNWRRTSSNKAFYQAFFWARMNLMSVFL
jgi:hypothetical protein